MVQQRRKVSSTDGIEVIPPHLRERRMFRLLLQSNPNYFGNALSSCLPARADISCNTHYEDILCVGYNPKDRLLAAVIVLRQSSGYDTGTRVSSAPEYVRFYFSCDNGKNWEDMGCASVDACNATTGMRQHAVFLELAEQQGQFATSMGRIKVVLSWNDRPPAGAPRWKPVFGNVFETTICLSSQATSVIEAHTADPAVEDEDRLCGFGLAADDDVLLAVVHAKKQVPMSGYHHLSFWLDKNNNGTFDTHLGMVDMPLPALGDIPPAGVDCALYLPVDLDIWRQDCAQTSHSLRVRAILSRSEAGCRSDSASIPGDRGCVDANLTLAPRVNAVPGMIALIGNQPANVIEQEVMSLMNMPAGYSGFMIQGVPLPRHSYKVEVSDDGVHWRPLMNEVMVTDGDGVVRRHRPDPETGRFNYLPAERNVSGVLACWDGAGVGKWQVRLRNYFEGMELPGGDIVVVHLGDYASPDDDPERQQIQEDKAAYHQVGLISLTGLGWRNHLLSA